MRSIVEKSQHLFRAYKTPLIYTSSSVLKALATLISGFIIAKFVSPSDFGLWTTLSLLISYALVFQGGFINGLNLELPFLLGNREEKRAHLYASVTQLLTTISVVLVLLLSAAVYLIYPFSDNKEKFGFLGVSVIIMCTFFQNYFLSTFRSNNQFLRLSYIQIVEAFLNILTIALVMYFGFYGMIAKAVSVILVYVSILAIYRPIKVKSSWNKEVFFNLLKVGMPIFMLAYIEVFALTVDKIFLLKFSNLESVGIYSFAFYAFAFTLLFSNSLASYIYPKLTYKYGETKDKLILWKYVKKITIILLCLQLPFAILGIFVIPYAITSYFPNYEGSILPMQILLLAGIFKGSIIGVNVLWSIKKWKYMITYQLFYAFLFIALTFLFVNVLDNKVVGISVGVLLCNFINLFSGIILSYKGTHEN